MREATIKRKTKETAITASINIDGSGTYDIDTRIGFFDHMLEQLSRHSLMDITLKASGDLHVDAHHTVEDAGIVLGQAFARAIGDKKGIRRYGFSYLPMDEALSRVSLDISGRPFLVWRVAFSQSSLGQMDTELFSEFFHAFAQNAGITLPEQEAVDKNKA